MTRTRCISPRLSVMLVSALLCLAAGSVGAQEELIWPVTTDLVYQDGNIVMEYKADIDAVWSACEKTVGDLQARDVQKERKISSGLIKSDIQNEKVTITVQYVSLNLTSVSVFVGVAGNNIASRLIHDKIAGYLAKP